MIASLQIFRARRKDMDGYTPPSPAERMARYSQRHAEEMRQRENLGAGLPRVRLVNGRFVLVALPGRPNELPKEGDA
ncbi:hypothetical protein [Dyella sp. 2RAB6]|uniref:hypothetical protein n=1 Tax=Dyella sp. 2RAB6 TaxID=3232992 RepID=UPI003F8E5304